ncbi:hypothetical protein [Microbacterium sp.]|uniref:hypothetical protein n=1 Tax=Microbacterium sp. TaxID=51671 RepID=UPI002FE05271
MNSDQERRDGPDDEPVVLLPEFASTLREAVKLRGVSLRMLRQRLSARGHEISVSTLSQWQSGIRRPERDTSFDVIRELEQLLLLDDGALTGALGPSRRVGHSEHRTFATLSNLIRNRITAEGPPELLERSGAVGIHVDAESRITRTVNRTLWQSRKDGAQRAAIFYGLNDDGVHPAEIAGTIGCEVVDIVDDPKQNLIRATLQLHAPLQQGALALTERETIESADAPEEHEFTIVAPRRQAEIMLYAVFDPDHLPRRCTVTIETDGEPRSHVVPLNGNCASHAEFNFGPGMVALRWDW